MAELAKLTPRHIEALAEIARHEGRNWIYWWRKASMADLAQHGYVEQYRPPSLANSRRKELPYRITAAGKMVVLRMSLASQPADQTRQGEPDAP